MISGACLTLITLMPLVLGWTLSLGTLEVLFFSIGFITSTQVISYPMIAESNDASHVGFATGIASLIIMAGGAVGQVLFGWLMQQRMQQGAGSYRSADFHVALWIFPIAAVIALLSVLLTRETFCGHAQKGDPLNAKNS
jgi:MFS family permease